MHLYRGLASAVVLSLPGLCPGWVYAAGTLIEALTYGQVSGQFRYRYEWVDQEKFDEKAKASTLRTQLGYLTDSLYGVTAFLQFENVAEIGQDQYNSTSNGNTGFPVVADPTGTEVNQAWLNYEAGYDTAFRFGRQALNLDNQRFIGSVAWRQNEQTMDAFTITNGSLPATTVLFSHVENVNRIFGEDHPNPVFRNFDLQGELFNIAYKGFSFGQLVGYAYLLDFENAPALSHKDLGLRFDGAYKPGPVKLLYTLEYADQSDYEDGPKTNDAEYGLASVGADYKGVQVRANYERLSGDGVYGFATPLATLHAHNGWADQFLITPKDGLEDAWLAVSTTFKGFTLLAKYHDFSSDHDSYDFGRELDFLIAKKLHKLLTVTLKYADYRGDDNALNVARNPVVSRDLSKLWLMLDVVF